MTTLLRYQPWSVHRELLSEFNRYFDRPGDRLGDRTSDRAGNNEAAASTAAEWSPSVDIEEYAEKFVLYADVPGVDPKSIEVTLEKGVLTLSGLREKAAEAAGIEARRTERSAGRFLRRFSLPDTVDGEAVSAKTGNGVLEVVIPKRPAVQPRKITVAH